MEKLIVGVRRFIDSEFKKEQELFESLAGGQSPETFFVTCSDSRVAPHLITQSQPGDLFVLRNAGNFIPGDHVGGESATLEYAVSVLKVRDVIICGHSDCGAVKALLHPPPADQLPSISGWLSHGAKVLEIIGRHPEWTGKERIDRAIEMNVLVQLMHLSQHPAVIPALERGELRLHGWVYDIGAGHVRAFDSEAGVFLPLRESLTSIPAQRLQTLSNTA